VSARRLFPYLATITVLLIVAVIFVLRPTPFIGANPGAVAASLEGGLPPPATASCERSGEDRWSCATTQPGGDRGYDLDLNGFGCWTAAPTGGAPRIGTPATISGCITLADH